MGLSRHHRIQRYWPDRPWWLQCGLVDWLLSLFVLAKYNDVDDGDLPTIRYKPEGLDELCERTNFTRKELQIMYRGFKQECPTGVVDKNTFGDIYQQYFPLGNAHHYSAYVFNTFDAHRCGTVTFEEFVSVLSVLSRGSVEQKLQWTFNLYDINQDGHISRDEMLDIVTAIYDMTGKHAIPPVDQEAIRNHVDNLFKKMDLNKDGIITIDEFMTTCLRDRDVVKSVTFFDTMLYPC